MSEFKFNQPERHNVERLLQQVRHMGLSVIEGVDRIEQIISARGESDGWVRVWDVPNREEAYQEGIKRNKHGNNVLWKSRIFSAGAMWMRMKLTGISDIIGDAHPSPPKPDQK